MNTLDAALRLAIVFFMLGSLAGVGLALRPREAVASLADIRFAALTLFVAWIVCPAAGLFTLSIVPTASPYATALLLLSLAPAAPFAPAFVQMARGNLAYLAAFMLLSAVSTVVLMPLEVRWLLPGNTVDAMAIARPLVLFVLMPLAAGAALRVFNPARADRTAPHLEKMTGIAGGAGLVLLVIIHGRGVIDAVGSYAIAALVLSTTIMTLAAYVCGAILPEDQRSVLTIGICTRNLGAALAPLAALEPDPRGVIMIVIAAPVTLLMSALTARYLARRHPAAEIA